MTGTSSLSACSSGSSAPRISQSLVRGVSVATIEPASVRQVCIAVMGFGAWLDAFELQRFALLAERLQARIIIPETPGLGHTPTRLTCRERGALMSGGYRPVAARMLAAASTVLTDGQSPHLLGYSMGASIATAMAATEQAERISSLTLVEPVGIRRWNPKKLISAVQHEDHAMDVYLAETAILPRAIAPSDRTPGAPEPLRNGLDQLLLASALCWGRTRRDLDRVASRHPHLPVLLMHGDISQLSRRADIDRLISSARRVGLDATDAAAQGGHGLWQSLPRVTELAKDINLFWQAG